MASEDAGDGGLAALFPATRSVTVAGRAIELKQIGLAQGSRIARMAVPILLERAGMSITEWVEEYPDEANPFIVIASGLEPDWVARLPVIDRCDLASHLMEFNAGFFVQRLLPILARMKRAEVTFNGDGLMFSTLSSQPGTEMPGITRQSKPGSTSKPLADASNAIGEPT